MPKIPYTSNVSALSNRVNSPLQTRRTDPAAMGAPVAEQNAISAQQLGKAAEDMFAVQERERERRRKEEKAVALANFDWTKQELDLRNKVGADAEDLQDRIRTGYQEYVDDYVNGIENDRVRQDVRTTLLSDLPNVSSRAAQYTYQTQTDNSKNRIDDALNGLQNKINTDPTQYDRYRQEGDALIDAAPNTTAAQREGMKYSWKYDSAKRRFDGRINTVKSIEDIDAIAAELAGGEGQRDWQKEMLPADYEGLMNTLGTMRKTFNDQNNTTARALLTDLEKRMDTDTSLLPVADLQAAQEAAKRTTDQSIQFRMGRLMRSQEIIRTEGRLTPAELQARINAASGNPGLAYPNLPVEVSNYINEVSERSGVPASYLGATANREYGSEFAKGKSKKADDAQKFKPVVANKNIDLRNVRSDVVDAVTAAGQVYGAPLTLTAATSGSVLSGNAVNIATPGMSGADKAKIAGALVDAGFTGIAEYDGYLQVDMTHAVPQSFGDKDGKAWGGWTYLSPEVAQVLKNKGFKAGADATAIQRVAAPEPGVNYNAPTGIVGSDGKPTSSAVGLYQFIESTWLNTIKRPGFAETVGIDISKMDDAQILALRSDPRVQTYAAAALAQENKRIMENTLGRGVDEAELYMAHFMGPTAATTFLTAYAANQDQSAADLLPQTADANAPVFYADPKNKKQPLTVAQVHANISRSFGLAPSRVAFGDNEVRKKMLANMQKTLASHPMEHAMSSGSHVVTPLQEGFSKRGAQARAVAEYYNLPLGTMKPFTRDEEDYIKKVISDGTVDENIQLYADIQSMGPEIAKGALEQIGVKDNVFSHAGSLYLAGERTLAGDITRGRKRIQDNPDLAKQVGATSDNTSLNDTFRGETGEALLGLEPSESQAVQESARALYVERMATRRGSTTWDDKVYKQAVHDVLGGALADVNGAMTLLPKGVDASTIEEAFYRMGVEDWAAMSVDGKPPQYPNGGVVDPQGIRDEAMLQAIGNGEYKVMLSDNTYLSTGERTPDGSRMKAFIFKPDADKIRRLSTKPVKYSDANIGFGSAQ